jgi:hypothetical protein
MPSTTLLREISEGAAPEPTATLYREIRRDMRVPVVALFYRNLAGIDGALNWMWDVVAPLLKSGRLEATAAHIAKTGTLVPLTPLAATAPAIGVIDAYNRANPLNFTCAAILAHLLAGEGSNGSDTATQSVTSDATLCAAPTQLPEMVATESMSPELRTAISRLETSDTAGDGIIPSLYRHLANWPDFLDHAVNALGPRFADGSLQTVAREIAAVGRAQTAVLIAGAKIAPVPAALLDQREAVSVSVEKFSRRIPEMIVVGRLLDGATKEDS